LVSIRNHYPPKIQGIPRLQEGIAFAAPAHAHAPKDLVHNAPQFPPKRSVIPACFAPNSPDFVQGLFRILQGNFAAIPEASVHRHLGIPCKAFTEDFAGLGVFPTGDHFVLFDFIKGQADGRPVIDELDAQVLGQGIGLGDDFDLHAVHQIGGQGVGGGRHKVQPVR